MGTSATRAASFQERASIWLALHHLRRHHRKQPEFADTRVWDEVARWHLELHRSEDGSLTPHCYWTPALAYPNLRYILFFIVMTVIPIFILAGVLPIPWMAWFIGWWANGFSVSVGFTWARLAVALTFLVLVGVSVIESVKLMFIPPDPQTLYNWEKFNDRPMLRKGPFTSLWPKEAPRVWLPRDGRWGKKIREDWGYQDLNEVSWVYKCQPPAKQKHRGRF